MKRLSVLITIVFCLAFGTGAWAAPGELGPLPGYNGFEITVANNANTYLMGFPDLGKGLNAEWVGQVGATSRTGLTTVLAPGPSFSGSLGLYDTGGGGSNVTDFILLVSLEGPVRSDFSLDLSWDSTSETFTAADFVYGPQTTKPASVPDMPLYPGQDIASPDTSAYLMFVDLQAGGTGLDNAVAVDYSFTGLYGDNLMAFNIYGFSPTGGNVNPGVPSINWTNDTRGATGNGYIVLGSGEPVPTPEPVSLLLVAFGLVGLAAIKRKTV